MGIINSTSDTMMVTISFQSILEQNSMMAKMTTYTSAVPKSGCNTTSASGRPTYTPSGNSSPSVDMGSLRVAKILARQMMMATLPNSEGCTVRSPELPQRKNADMPPRPASMPSTVSSTSRLAT